MLLCYWLKAMEEKKSYLLMLISTLVLILFFFAHMSYFFVSVKFWSSKKS